MLSGGPIPNNDSYNILQIHFHWGEARANSINGSEHTYYTNNTRFPLEMHIVHVKKGYDLNGKNNFTNFIDGLAVTGFMFYLTVKDLFKVHILNYKRLCPSVCVCVCP